MTADEQNQDTISALYAEHRTFPPPAAFAAQANVSDPEIYERAAADPESYWAGEAESIDWIKPWDSVLSWDPPFARWFDGGQLNVSYNCLDRHVERGDGDRVAYYWEGEPGDSRVITYRDLLHEVQQCANALKSLGISKGDRVAIYMPMIPELPVAMLACARIGAPHTVVFGGFSSSALADRINDAEATVVITADGGFRRGLHAGLKVNVDAAMESTPGVTSVLVVKRTGENGGDGRRSGYLVARSCAVPGSELPTGSDGERGYALSPLHLGHDRQTKRHSPYDGRISGRGCLDPSSDFRSQTG